MNWKKIWDDMGELGKYVFFGSLLYFHNQYGILWHLEATWLHAIHIFGIILLGVSIVGGIITYLIRKIRKND